MWQVNTPKHSDEWQAYYDLRWHVLRAPWQQPRGSEKDELEDHAEHRCIKNDAGEVVAVARLHFNTPSQAQVRYMAVAEGQRNQHLGSRLLYALEQYAWQHGAESLVLDAREQAQHFYTRHGYTLVEKGHLAFGEVQHYRLCKTRPAKPEWFLQSQWLSELEATWHKSIPISAAMGIEIASHTDWQFSTRASISANINLHQTMFAGSIYSHATLTGWGAVHLLLKAKGLEGDIVLADGKIRYAKPLKHSPNAEVCYADCQGELETLMSKSKAKITVPVTVYDGNTPVAYFEGCFVVIKKAP